MHTGWRYDGNYWEYYGSNGAAYESQWLLDGGYWYYLDASGNASIGTDWINGKNTSSMIIVQCIQVGNSMGIIGNIMEIMVLHMKVNGY